MEVPASGLPESPPGFTLLAEVGRGGMGVVYRARDHVIGREVAIKILRDSFHPGLPIAQRFSHEARITGQLQHPGIPAVHQIGTMPDGRPYLAMKLIKGCTLADSLKHRADLSADRGRLLAVFEVICQAVAYAHAHHVIHRDLKPSNVMVGAFAEVQVMDWGLAKVLGDESGSASEALEAELTRAWTQISPSPGSASSTQIGSMVGTPAYIPPEQALGEIKSVNERSDVFGLGAVLAEILTGSPPYVGESAEEIRAQAVRGKIAACYARLDACGADLELITLCKQCLSAEPSDRPPDAGAVAQAVAAFRAAAEERARRAEREQAATEARVAERQKRRRLWLGAAAALTVAIIGGLLAVLRVQAQARQDLEVKNRELAREKSKVQTRFDLAQKAIATFHTGVSEDALLKNEQFRDLRTRLLKEAANFYSAMEQTLAGESDPKSRKALADGYFQLAELTDRIGDKKEALAVHRKALAVRRELASVPRASAESRLDVARSLRAEAEILRTTGDLAGALAAHEEQRDLAAALDAQSSTDAVREQLALAYRGIGIVLAMTRKPAEGLASARKALEIQQKLADSHPADTQMQNALATTYEMIGTLLGTMGEKEQSLDAFRKAIAICQKLSNNNPRVVEFQAKFAAGLASFGFELSESGRYEEALASLRRALPIQRQIVATNPAVSDFQWRMANTLHNTGHVHIRLGQYAEALTALDEGITICTVLTKAHPTNQRYLWELGWGLADRGEAKVRTGKPAEAATDLRDALGAWAKVPVPNPDVRFDRSWVLALLAGLGQDPKSGITPKEAAEFADQSIAALRDAVAAGWHRTYRLNDKNFDPVRARDDFQKIVGELKATEH